MSGAKTRSGTADNHVFDRTTDVPLSDPPAEQSTAGIVHDLGNLIQVASSALNRVARDPSVSTAPALDPVIASARTALQQAGALVGETVGRAAASHRAPEHASVGACLAEVENLVRSAWETNVRLEVRVGAIYPLRNAIPWVCRTRS